MIKKTCKKQKKTCETIERNSKQCGETKSNLAENRVFEAFQHMAVRKTTRGDMLKENILVVRKLYGNSSVIS